MRGGGRALALGRTAGALALAGAIACSPVLFDLSEDGQPPARYELAVPQREEPCAPRAGLPTLLVERPSVRESIDGARIAARFPGGEVRYLAEVRWASPLAAMLHHVLIESLASDCLDVVGDTPALAGSHVLSTEVAQFHAVADSDGLRSVRIELRVRLLGGSPPRIVELGRVSASAPIANGEVESVIAAFDEALAEVIRGIRRFAADAIRGAPPSR